jgi:hypothetical protein
MVPVYFSETLATTIIYWHVEHTVSMFSPEDGDSISPKRWHIPTSLHGSKTQDVITAAKTSNTILWSENLKGLNNFEHLGVD